MNWPEKKGAPSERERCKGVTATGQDGCAYLRRHPPRHCGRSPATIKQSSRIRIWIVQEGLGFGWPGGDLLSRALGRSTISAEAFNGRVRDGIGFWAPRSSHRTGQTQAASPKRRQHPRAGGDPRPHRQTWSRRSDPRTWITRAIKPIERLVPVGSTRRRACTPGLSTWSSSTALWGVLVSREVSRLDAFSGYPVRT